MPKEIEIYTTCSDLSDFSADLILATDLVTISILMIGAFLGIVLGAFFWSYMDNFLLSYQLKKQEKTNKLFGLSEEERAKYFYGNGVKGVDWDDVD